MNEPIIKTAPAGTEAGILRTNEGLVSNNILAPQVYNNVPVIARDVYEHLPQFYKSALVVMARNGRCTITEV